jgi:hypothetical protein
MPTQTADRKDSPDATLRIIGRLDPPAFHVEDFPGFTVEQIEAGLIVPAVVLTEAETRLMQALDCPRLGYIADSFTQDAADLLRTAGEHNLADRLDDDPWSDDVRAVADEVTKLRVAL